MRAFSRSFFATFTRARSSWVADDDESAAEEAVEMLLMTNKYLIPHVQRSIEEQSRKRISSDSFCAIYAAAFACSANDLKERCLMWSDWHSSRILTSTDFSALHVNAVEEMITRESFRASQVALFTALSSWIGANDAKEEVRDRMLANVRLTEMPLSFLSIDVRNSGLISDNRILDAIAAMCSSPGVDTSDANSMHFPVCVRPLVGTPLKGTTIFDLYPFDTVARLKDRIRIWNPKIGSVDRLTFSGIVLEDRRTLARIGPNAEIYLL